MWVKDVDATLLEMVEERVEFVEREIVRGGGGGGGFGVRGEGSEEPVVTLRNEVLEKFWKSWPSRAGLGSRLVLGMHLLWRRIGMSPA